MTEGNKIVTLPNSIREEALSGGFSSLWLPVEIGVLHNVSTQSISMNSGSRYLVIGLCVQGEGWFEQARVRHSVTQGQVWVASPGIPFSFGSHGKKNWSQYWCNLTGARVAWFRNLLVSEGESPVFDVPEMLMLVGLLQKASDLIERGAVKKNLDCASLIFGHLLAELRLARMAAVPGPESVSERIDRVTAWMKEQTRATVDIAELAAMCNLSPSYFTACFRAHTGYRVLDYYARIKMEKACRMLRNSGLHIKEIAARVGYADQLYFSRSFKKIYECPPLVWRERHRDTQQGEAYLEQEPI